MRTVTILGATGSIGQQTLEVVRQHRSEFEVRALTARRGSDTLAQLCVEFEPEFAVVADEREAAELRRKLETSSLRTGVCIDGNHSELDPVFSADVVVTSIVGAAGLHSTLRAIQAGNTVLITNKEPVVMLGSIIRDEVRKAGTTVIPTDSEHNAIFQCCSSKSGDSYECFFPIGGLRRILLTGSGGPFRTARIESLKDISPDEALAHPIWKMGPKISIDSATMMNKGLEIIEARWLFDTPVNQIDVVIHPQGIVHSMVEYLDGSLLAQMATPDMRVPLAHGLFWPRRMDSGASRLDVFDLPSMSFEPPDFKRFPCLELAHSVAASGGTAPTVMNAANEVAVDAFLSSRIRFTDIFKTVMYCVERMGSEQYDSVETIIEIDRLTRETANRKIDGMSGR